MIDFPKDARDRLGIKDRSSQRHGNPHIQQQGRDRSQSEQAVNVPELIFRDENGYRKKELFTDHAMAYADAMMDMTQTQLRKYYNEVKALEARIKANPDFKANEALIGLLKSKVAYGMAKETDRDRKKAFKVLLHMTEQGIEWSTKPEYFEDFVLFFEAVIGFFRGR